MSSALPMHVALVSEMDPKVLSPRQLSLVSAALAKQVSRDFGPIWGVNATVDAFHSLDDVPAGYWPIIIEQDIQSPGAAGYHTDQNGNPFALVQFSSSWSLTASHECLEMLADPFGNRVVATVSPWDGKARVEVLVEVCDPSEDVAFAYSVNGVVVSDFYTPRYFDPTTATGVRYSFTDAIKKPRDVLKGGYVSFHDLKTNHWKQIQFFGAKKKLADLGVMQARSGKSLREQVDAMSSKNVPALIKGFPKSSPMMMASASMVDAGADSSDSKAKMWREQIGALMSAK